MSVKSFLWCDLHACLFIWLKKQIWIPNFWEEPFEQPSNFGCFLFSHSPRTESVRWAEAAAFLLQILVCRILNSFRVGVHRNHGYRTFWHQRPLIISVLALTFCSGYVNDAVQLINKFKSKTQKVDSENNKLCRWLLFSLKWWS